MSWNFDVRKGPISVEWFKGGLTNICYNALDRCVCVCVFVCVCVCVLRACGEAPDGQASACVWVGATRRQTPAPSTHPRALRPLPAGTSRRATAAGRASCGRAMSRATAP